jgi:hypothetical protein
LNSEPIATNPKPYRPNTLKQNHEPTALNIIPSDPIPKPYDPIPEPSDPIPKPYDPIAQPLP